MTPQGGTQAAPSLPPAAQPADAPPPAAAAPVPAAPPAAAQTGTMARLLSVMDSLAETNKAVMHSVEASGAGSRVDEFRPAAAAPASPTPAKAVAAAAPPPPARVASAPGGPTEHQRRLMELQAWMQAGPGAAGFSTG